jgi:hypothetical protein
LADGDEFSVEGENSGGCGAFGEGVEGCVRAGGGGVGPAKDVSFGGL